MLELHSLVFPSVPVLSRFPEVEIGWADGSTAALDPIGPFTDDRVE